MSLGCRGWPTGCGPAAADGSPEGALAVLCVVHARRLERVEDAVLIVSLDRLAEALRTAAGTRKRPTLLAGQAPPQPKMRQ
jgi:hypothetical protein